MEFLSILLVIAVALIFYTIYTDNKRKAAKTKALRDAYDEALLSGDKAKALQTGRAYHSFLRKGKLTIYDEQAITNDLSTMK
jgi:hypothetical protein